jgi:RES domain-containing protein
MKFGRIQPNPRFSELYEALSAHPDWLKPWSGVFFRFQTVDFPAPTDVLSGQGARQRGGRWNRPGISALYGSTTDTTALEESKANDRYYSIETKSPRLLVAIEARLVGVIDLTSTAIRRAMGITLIELAAEDWRKLLQSGRESTSQALGRAAAVTGASGLLVRSAAVPMGVNVVVFPYAHKNDRLTVAEGDKLSQLRIKPGA